MYNDYKLENIGLINTDQQMCMLMWYTEKTRFAASLVRTTCWPSFRRMPEWALKHISKALFVYSAAFFYKSKIGNDMTNFKIYSYLA